MMIPSAFREAVQCLAAARHVVVFTGAGVSAESGIPTFRDSGGFWTEFPPQQFANWSSLLKLAALEPRRLAQFLLAVIEPIARALPNPAHLALARLEDHARLTVVTQNIDGLHQDAGSTTVLEIHGTLLETVNVSTGRFERLVTRAELQQIADRLRGAMDGLWPAPRLAAAIQPIFGPGLSGMHRPNLVLFGDALCEPAWTQALAAARACDVLLSVGTSGVVHPAAMLPLEAASSGATVISVDPHEATGHIHLQGAASSMLTSLLAEVEQQE